MKPIAIKVLPKVKKENPIIVRKTISERKNDLVNVAKLNKILKVNVQTNSEQNVPVELEDKDSEKNELKLLEYQLKNKDTSVNQFLLDKYTEGNFNKAVLNTFDNSKKRIEAGLEYQYHCYYEYKINGIDPFLDNRPNDFLISTNEIVDYRTNDSYFYHFAIHNFSETEYQIDFTGEILLKNSIKVQKNPSLFNALQILSEQIKNNDSRLDQINFDILKRSGFILDNGELKLDNIKNDILVSKYFKGFKNEKKNLGIDYLNDIGDINKYKKDKDNNNNSNVKKSTKPEDIYKIIESTETKYKTDGSQFKLAEKEYRENEELITYFKNKSFIVKRFTQIGETGRHTEELPILIFKGSTPSLFLITFSKGMSSLNINKLTAIVKKTKHETYNELNSGFIRNSDEISKLNEFFKDKSVDLMIKMFNLSYAGGFEQTKV